MTPSMKQSYFERALKKRYPRRPPRRLRKLLFPTPTKNRYERSLDEIIGYTKSLVDSKIKTMLTGLASYYNRERQDDDETLEDLASELEKVRIQTFQEYTPEEIKRLAEITGRSVAEWNAAQMNGQLQAIVEIDLFGQGGEPWLAREMGAFVSQNVSLIQSLPEEYLSQVEKVIGTSIRSGIRVEEIAAELEDRFDVAKSRATLIARDQVGKFNGQLTELRQKDLGIEEYTRRGVGDERERESHRILNDEVFRWDDPPEVGHPGDDFDCRCWAEPVLAKFYEDEDNG